MLRKLLLVGVFLVVAGAAFWTALVHTVHLGTVAVPELLGIELEAARRAAHDVGLDVEVMPPAVFSQHPPGSVATQDPYPGIHVKDDSAIRVRLSRGTETVEVPAVSGLVVARGLRELEVANLDPTTVNEVRGEGPGGVVLATDPEAGRVLPPAAEVAVLVNAEPPRRAWVTPSFLSLDEDEVRALCTRHRLRLGQVHRVEYQGLPSGTVLRQYPPAGGPLGRSDILTLWVSR